MPRFARPVAASLLALVTVAGLFATGAEAAPRGRFALGDSVMLGAKPNLQHKGFRVDASISRQVSGGISVLRRKADDGSLRTNVVVHLGTNGTFTKSQCRAMRSAVGKQRRLFLVTVKVPRSWERSNNKVISRCAARYGNVYLVDWRRHVSRHRGLLESDGYHLTSKGARHYARLVDGRVDTVQG